MTDPASLTERLAAAARGLELEQYRFEYPVDRARWEADIEAVLRDAKLKPSGVGLQQDVAHAVSGVLAEIASQAHAGYDLNPAGWADDVAREALHVIDSVITAASYDAYDAGFKDAEATFTAGDHHG